MKKLLSLLSVLTISGTSVPTTIAASPYQKEESLNRNKRNIKEISNLINEIKNIKFNGILKTVFTGIETNLRADMMFVLENLLYFKYDGISNWYEYNPNTKNTIKTELGHKVYNLNSSFIINNRNNKNPILHNKEYFILKDNIFNDKVYEKNIITNEQKNIINGNIKIKGIILNNKIYFLGDDTKLYEYWPFESMLEQDESLINWKQLFSDWRNNMDFDFKNNFVSKSTNGKQSWINNKKHELLVKIDNLKDKINIIKNRESIEQLNIQFLSLENKVNDLKLKVNDLLNNSSNLSINCSNITTIVSGGAGLTALSTSTLTPVVGAVVGSIITIIGGICAINNV